MKIKTNPNLGSTMNDVAKPSLKNDLELMTKLPGMQTQVTLCLVPNQRDTTKIEHIVVDFSFGINHHKLGFDIRWKEQFLTEKKAEIEALRKSMNEFFDLILST